MWYQFIPAAQERTYKFLVGSNEILILSFLAPEIPPLSPMQREFPQEVIDDLIDLVSVGSTGQRDPDLRACSLVSWNWVERSQQRLFYSIELASTPDISRWIRNIRPGVGGVSRYVKKLWIHFGWDQWSQRFPSVDHLKSFASVQDLRLTYWCGGQERGEVVEEAFIALGRSVRSLTVSLPRGDAGSFLHLLSLFLHLDNLSILTSYLDEASEAVPRNLVTLRGSLMLDGVQEHFINALVGSRLKPNVLRVSIPNLTSFDKLLAACAPSVETIFLSPSYGQCLPGLSQNENTTADLCYRNRRVPRSHLSDQLYGLKTCGDQAGASKVLLCRRAHRSAADPFFLPGEGDVQLFQDDSTS